MTMKLFIQAITKIILGILLVGLLLFLPAGTFSFFNGWLLMAVLFLPMFFVGVIMMLKSPELLKRRLNAKEKQKEQGHVVKLSALMFVAGFAVAGLDFRFGWSDFPKGVVIAGLLVFLSAYLFYGEVLRENSYLSRTIEVQKNQKVVETGLYGIVRHPMYLATIFLFLAMPIILGSIWSFLIFLFYPFIIVKRIRYEEKFLEKELHGYSAYKQKIKYRLFPFIW